MKQWDTIASLSGCCNSAITNTFFENERGESEKRTNEKGWQGRVTRRLFCQFLKESLSLFHLHFLSWFFTNFVLPKQCKRKLILQKSFKKQFCTKKLLVKCLWQTSLRAGVSNTRPAWRVYAARVIIKIPLIIVKTTALCGIRALFTWIRDLY